MICPKCGASTEGSECVECGFDIKSETIYLIGLDSEIMVQSICAHEFIWEIIDAAEVPQGRKEDWKKEYEQYSSLAEQGDANAQDKMGDLFLKISPFGGVEAYLQVIEESLEWYRKAADQGHIKVQLKLGDYLSEGLYLVPIDLKEAIKWYTRAVEQGNVDAMRKLGNIYNEPEITEIENISKQVAEEIAFEWFKKAVEHGDQHAMFHLAVMYNDGEGTERDAQEAIRLAMESMKKSDRYVKKITGELLAQIYMNSEIENAIVGIEKELSPSQREEYEKIGNPLRKSKWLFDNNKLDERNIDEVKKILEKYKLPLYQYLPWAEQGDPDGQYEIGWLYEYGKDGVEEDLKEAVKWYTLAAAQRHIESQKKLGFLYYFKYGELAEKRDEAKEKAFKWYKMAAEQGDEEAIAKIANMYYEGDGTARNLEEALKWIRPLAVEGGHNHIELFGEIYQEKELEEVAESIIEKLDSDHLEDYKSIDNFKSKIDWLKDNVPGAEFIIDFEEKVINDRLEAEIAEIRSNPELEINRKLHMVEIGFSSTDDHYKLGRLYRFGDGGAPRDYKEAAKWFKLASDQGHLEAMRSLADLYHDGYLIEDNNEANTIAFKLYKKAAEQGSELSMIDLAEMYYLGKGTEKNLDEALKWIKKPASIGLYLAKDLQAKICMELLLDRIIGKSISTLLASQIGDYKALDSPDDHIAWISENVPDYADIMEKEWKKMQGEYDIKDIDLEDIL